MTHRILVVDDQPDLRLLIRLTLRAQGEVVLAASAAAALAQLAESAYDLLVLDICLGDGVNGLALCRQLRDAPATRGLKIMLLSGCGQTSEVEAGLAAGADHYMVKPFSPEELAAAATALLGQPASPAR